MGIGIEQLFLGHTRRQTNTAECRTVISACVCQISPRSRAAQDGYQHSDFHRICALCSHCHLHTALWRVQLPQEWISRYEKYDLIPSAPYIDISTF